MVKSKKVYKIEMSISFSEKLFRLDKLNFIASLKKKKEKLNKVEISKKSLSQKLSKFLNFDKCQHHHVGTYIILSKRVAIQFLFSFINVMERFYGFNGRLSIVIVSNGVGFVL